MTELHELKDIEEQVILLAVSTGEEEDTEACLDELEDLVETAGAVCALLAALPLLRAVLALLLELMR